MDCVADEGESIVARAKPYTWITNIAGWRRWSQHGLDESASAVSIRARSHGLARGKIPREGRLAHCPAGEVVDRIIAPLLAQARSQGSIIRCAVNSNSEIRSTKKM